MGHFKDEICKKKKKKKKKIKNIRKNSRINFFSDMPHYIQNKMIESKLYL